jgi:hypothetical protein
MPLAGTNGSNKVGQSITCGTLCASFRNEERRRKKKKAFSLTTVVSLHKKFESLLIHVESNEQASSCSRAT